MPGLRFVLAAIVAAGLAGCAGTSTPAGTGSTGTFGTVGQVSGSAGSGSPTQTPTSTSRSGGTISLVVGVADNGHVVPVRVGRRFAVVLGPNWTAPTAEATSASALRVVSATGFPTAPIGSATFDSLGAGSFVITAHTDYSCLHSVPACALAQQAFRVTIRISA